MKVINPPIEDKILQLWNNGKYSVFKIATTLNVSIPLVTKTIGWTPIKTKIQK